MQAQKRLHSGMIRRILKEAFCLRRQREYAVFNRDVLDSLQDLTGVTSAELALINRKLAGEADLFSSIRLQLLAAGVILFVFPILPLFWLLY